MKAPNLARLDEYPLVSIDVETTGTYWYRDTVFGVAIAARTEGGEIRSGYWDVRESPRILDALRDKAPRLGRVVNHNMKFDALFLNRLGVHFNPAALECTSVRAALINEHEPSFSLDALSLKYTGRRKVDEIYAELATMFGGKPTRDAQILNLHRAPVALARKYAIADPELAILLWLEQEKEIKKQELEEVWALERELMPVLIDLELGGVRVDVELATKNLQSMDQRIVAAQQELNRLAGKEVNPNSPPQMKAMFGVRKKEGTDIWETDSGILLPSTDTGNASIDADTLRSMQDKDPRARAAFMIRQLVKAKSFLKDHILGHEVNGHVFPNYNQTRGENDLGTGTGRFSINDPALQQIPKRNKEIAALTRACFIPDASGDDWCSADWDQFEFRWFAHYVNNPRLNATYADDPDADFHRMVADLTGLNRSAQFSGDPNAKQINLGLVFGMGEGKMASEMGLPFTVRKQLDGDGNVIREWLNAGPEAQEVFAKYHEAVPGVKELLGQASSIAKARGYVKTIVGRRIRFPGGKFTHKAAGLVFQGTSADCMKRKMIELHPLAKKSGSRMLLSVHDELNFSIPKGNAFSNTVKSTLETFDGEACPIRCRIPIRSSVVNAANWWEASK